MAAWILGFAWASACAGAAESRPWDVLVVGRPAECEQLAVRDLQCLLAWVSGGAPRVVEARSWKGQPCPAVILGTPEANPLLAERAGDCADLGEEGYLLNSTTVEGAEVVTVCGHAPRGVVHGIYGLLGELGFGFYFGSLAAPESLPERPAFTSLRRKPALATRGVLGWYNFFNSPTVWDPQDHRAAVDQLIRMGANYLCFHTYDHEPFAAWEEAGRMAWGSRLLNTAASTWGTEPMSTRDFAGGTDLLFADDHFGARSTLAEADPDAAVRLEQQIMRDALDYARRRGLRTCLGFEINGDPTRPQDRDVFLRRINRLLDAYPALDDIAIWQPETQGAQGYAERYAGHMLRDPAASDSPLRLYGTARREVFRRIVERTAGEKPFFQDTDEGRIARAMEGARLEQFAWLALRALARRENPPRLVISGWGGDERLLSAEYYEGLDRLLPDSVIFASLDHIIPRPRVDRVYGELPPKRTRWPIPWLELDGDQWHPQPFVATYEPMMRDILAGGSQGVLGIHWRTRDIEENLAYMIAAAWNPQLTAEQFFADLAARCYPPAIAGRMAGIHRELDALGYRWIGGPGQAECAPFGWGPGEPAKVAALKELRQRVAALQDQAGRSQDRLRWLLGVMDWVLAFQEAQTTALAAEQLLAGDARDPQRSAEAARQALELLDSGVMERALQTFATRLSTRGEHGVLATINTKAVAAWRRLRQRAAEAVGSDAPAPPTVPWTPPPGVVMPRLLTSVPGGTSIELLPIVLGGGPARMCYRPLGTAGWKETPLEPVRGWVRRGVIPAEEVVEPGLEYAFVTGSASPDRPAWGPKALTVMPPTAANTSPRPRRPPPSNAVIEVRVAAGREFPAEVSWNDVPEADFFRVLRDGRPVADTAVPFCPDAPMGPKATYVVEAWRDGRVLGRSAPVVFDVPEVVIEESPKPVAEIRDTEVVLEWPAATARGVFTYRVYRYPASAPPSERRLLAEVAASRHAGHLFQDAPGSGRWHYEIVPTTVTGKEGPAGAVEAEIMPRPPRPPVLTLPLTTRPAEAEVVGDVTFGEDGATFRGGHIALPHQPWMNLGRGLTVDFEFRADEVGSMPVLICHGAWQADGWFVQILGGSLIVRTPDGDATGPPVVPKQWHTVRFVFDGRRLHLAVDGRWTDRPPAVVRAVPARRSLILGQYEQQAAAHAFRGSLRHLVIHDEARMSLPATRPQ